MHRKVIAFDFDHDMHRLQQICQRSMATFQELVNEVFADLLKDALRKRVKATDRWRCIAARSSKAHPRRARPHARESWREL